jgi:ParB family chromosome partitioning protein
MAPNKGPARAGKLRFISVQKLERGSLQPRQAIDGPSLTQLAESIRTKGVIQPIYVRKVRGSKYEIVAGERRWHAAKMAGLKNIPCIVGDVPDNTALAIALIENLHREDLNPIDQAVAIRRLVDEFAMTHQQIADTIGKSRATVTNLLRLLELPSNVREMVTEGELDMGHARALLALPGDAREPVAEQVAREHLSVRAVEKIGRRPSESASVASLPQASLGGALYKSLRDYADVKLRKNGRWRLSVEFTDIDELHSVLGAIEELLAKADRPDHSPSLILNTSASSRGAP